MPDIAVFAPHPDDDILGCGGTIARHIDTGQTVTIVYLTSGESGSLSIPKKTLGLMREDEAVQAAQVLGVSDVRFMRWPDGYLDLKPTYLAELTTLIRNLQPMTAYVPHSDDAVSDHQITNRLVREGIRRAAGPWFQECGGEPWVVPVILGYEVWTPLSLPANVVDVTAYASLKMRSIQCHHSQLAGFRYDDGIMGWNRYRGFTTGAGQYCECFQVIRDFDRGNENRE